MLNDLENELGPGGYRGMRNVSPREADDVDLPYAPRRRQGYTITAPRKTKKKHFGMRFNPG